MSSSIANKHIENAKREVDSAEYLLNVTLRSLKDPHLFVNIISHVNYALQSAINGLLEYDLEQKMISDLATDVEERERVFKQKSCKLHHIEQLYITFITRIRKVMELHEKSPMEFTRGNKYVIADTEYRLEPLTVTSVQQDIYTAKLFINRICEIIDRKT